FPTRRASDLKRYKVISLKAILHWITERSHLSPVRYRENSTDISFRILIEVIINKKIVIQPLCTAALLPVMSIYRHLDKHITLLVKNTQFNLFTQSGLF